MLTSEVFEGRYIAEEAETIVIDGKRWLVYVDAVVEIWRTTYPGDSATPEAEDRDVADWWIKWLAILPEDGPIVDLIELVSDSKYDHHRGFNPDEVFDAVMETKHFQRWMNEVEPRE